MRLDLADDPAVIEMADVLGIEEQCVVGYLHAIWSWASRHCNDGSVTGVTLKSFSRVTRCGAVPELMVNVGWLKVLEVDGKPVLRFPNWDRHMSQSAKKRALTSRRVAESRHGKCNAASVTEALPEKRREEKRRDKESTNVLSSPTADTTGPATGANSEYGFPIQGDKTWYLSSKRLDEYRDTYANRIDIDGELRKARQWLRDNRNRRKTAGGMHKFLTGWLNRVSDRVSPEDQQDPDEILRQRREKRRSNDVTE